MTINKLYEEFELNLKNSRVVEVDGWIKSVRNSKNLVFIDLSDGTSFSFVQIVCRNDLPNFDDIAKLTVGSSINVSGELISVENKKQSFEINAKEINIIGNCPEEYPLQKKNHSLEFLRTLPHLRARSTTFSSIFRIRSVLSYAIHSFFQERSFIYVNTPIITGSDCEGAGEMFRVTNKNPFDRDLEKKIPTPSEDFFGKEAFLTVSGQLEAEMFAMAMHSVYTFGPTFRAENSNTSRHAAEFWMVEPEMAFCDLNKNIETIENMLKYTINKVFEKLPNEMNFFNDNFDNDLIETLKTVAENKFEKITYAEAIKLLEKEKDNFVYPVQWGLDLQTEHERFLVENIFKKPIFVINYPKDIKSFYMRLNDDEKTVAAVDCLVPKIGEIVGGSQREERLDVLMSRMKELNININEYKEYIETRKFGGAPHSGFGLGFERLVMYLTGISNIRDVIAFPRTVGNL